MVEMIFFTGYDELSKKLSNTFCNNKVTKLATK